MPEWLTVVMSINVAVSLSLLLLIAAIPRGDEEADAQALEYENTEL